MAMLRLAVVFLAITLVTAFLGFGGVANYSWEGARILCVIFFVLTVLAFINGTFWRQQRPRFRD
jgi:uncharacterized membrane protein YtjA (UPF0391 family)